MADSEVVTLLENIKVNCRDSTNFTALIVSSVPRVKEAIVADTFSLSPRNTPFVVIVPGEPEDERELVQTVIWWQPVRIYIAQRRNPDPTRERKLLGGSNLDGLDSLAKDLRQALDRPSPYNGRKPSGVPPTIAGTYTTQTTVDAVEYRGQTYLGDEDVLALLGPEGPEKGLPVVVIRLDMRYRMVDTRRSA